MSNPFQKGDLAQPAHHGETGHAYVVYGVRGQFIRHAACGPDTWVHHSTCRKLHDDGVGISAGDIVRNSRGDLVEVLELRGKGALVKHGDASNVARWTALADLEPLE